MRAIKQLLFQSLVCCGFICLLCVAEPVKVAVVFETPDLAASADVLTTVLSSQDGIVLLEREKIGQIVSEQALSILVGAEMLKLGSLLGADGIIALQVTNEGTNQMLGTRLISVRHGVVLRDSECPLEMGADLDRVRHFVRQIESLLPKLTLLPKDAVPISVLNLRSATQTRDSESLDRQLTTLLLRRLAAEPAVFVLERQRLETMSFERELARTTHSLWTAAYLLDGTVNGDGQTKDEVSVSVRLLAPGLAEPIAFDVHGRSDGLATIMDDLVKQVLVALQRTSHLPDWSPADEAGTFQQEAQWALRWRMWKDAQAAADAAWALGNRSEETAIARVRAYREDARTDPGPSYCSQQRQWIYFSRPPNPVKLASALRALAIYETFSRQNFPDPAAVEELWSQVGGQVVETASELLWHFYLTVEARRGGEPELAELRARTREVAEWVSQTASMQRSFWPASTERADPSELRKSIALPGNVWRVKARYGPLWQETPEQGLTVYRELMESPRFGYVRREMLHRDLASPRLCGWNWTDRKRAAGTWTRFVDELCASTNAVLKIEGELLKVAEATDDSRLTEAVGRLREDLVRSPSLLPNPDTCAELPDALNRLAYLVRSSVATAAELEAERILRECEQMVPRPTGLAGVSRSAGTSSTFESQVQFLTQNSSFQPLDFARQFRKPTRMADEAKGLLPLLETYQTNLVRKIAADTNSAELNATLVRVKALETSLRFYANRPRLSATTATMAAPSPASAQTVAAGPITYGQITYESLNWIEPASSCLAPSECRTAPEVILGEKPTLVTVKGRIHREGRLWFRVHYDVSVKTVSLNFGATTTKNRTAIFGFDPRNGEPDVIPLPAEHFVQAGQPYKSFTDSFEVLGGYLYAVGAESLCRFELNRRTWSELPVAVTPTTRLQAVGGRLYVLSEESILQLATDGLSTKVLASSRRRPSAGILDQAESYTGLRLFGGVEGNLRAALGDKLYAQSGNAWTVRTLTATPTVEVFQNGALLRSGSHADINRLSICWTPSDTLECAVEIPGGNFIPHPPRWPLRTHRRDGKAEEPRWQGLPYRFSVNSPATAQGTNLLMYVERTREDRDGDLIVFDRDWYTPVMLPLRFDPALGQVPVTAELRKTRYRLGLTAGPWILADADRILIGHDAWPGFWSISAAAFQTRVEAEKARMSERARARSRNRPWPDREREIIRAGIVPLVTPIPWATMDGNANGLLDPKKPLGSTSTPTGKRTRQNWRPRNAAWC